MYFLFQGMLFLVPSRFFHLVKDHPPGFLHGRRCQRNDTVRTAQQSSTYVMNASPTKIKEPHWLTYYKRDLPFYMHTCGNLKVVFVLSHRNERVAPSTPSPTPPPQLEVRAWCHRSCDICCGQVSEPPSWWSISMRMLSAVTFPPLFPC